MRRTLANGRTLLWISIFFAILIIAVWFATALVVPALYGAPENPGTFGDMFGATNALFSGLAFLALIFALILQSQELKLQREELEATRKELQGQKEQMALQNETLRKQSFENTFFQLLRLHQEIVGSLDIRTASADASGTILGRDCFVRYYKALRRYFQKAVSVAPTANTAQQIERAYIEFSKEYQTDLGHYFRSLYNLVKFVDTNVLTDEEKYLYTRLVRAQLSSQELLVLFYNCISSFGHDKFHPLVEQYGLLKGLPKDQLIDRSHVAFYGFSAFGKRPD